MIDIYDGRGAQKSETPKFDFIERKDDPKDYRADPKLAKAVNVAMLLGQPLLVTGLPGTGKTQLAHSIAWELKLGQRALQFNTKSTSVARELFYTYDTLGRFQASYDKEASREPVDYIHYNALGRALLLANTRHTYEHLLPRDFEHPGHPIRSVVLIDEIDKAPRDFPNDLLDEIASMRFRITELRNAPEVSAPDEMRPIVVITSNSEKNLPDAFLRRCVYHHITPPDKKELERIVSGHLKELAADSRGVSDALDLFILLRDEHSGLSKKPGTAELIGWLAVLRKNGADFNRALRQQRPLVDLTVGVLVKLYDDLDPARKVVQRWAK